MYNESMESNKNKNLIVLINRRFAWVKVVLAVGLIALVGVGGFYLTKNSLLKPISATEGNVAIEKTEKEKRDLEEKQKKEEELKRIKEEKRQEEIKKQAEEKKIAAEREANLRKKREAEEKIKKVVAAKNGKKVIALTFDDGPSRATTPRLLDILKQKQVKVTFFVLGSAARYGKDIVRREFNEGHEIQGHTMWHGAFNAMSREQIMADIKQADDLMMEMIGRKPDMIRPPYGAMSQAAREVVGRPFMCWDVDTLDWKYRNSASVRQRAVGGAHNGAIVLMHDIHMTTVNAVAGIIDDLRAQGYEFVTISELAAIRGVNLVPGKEYWGI